MANPRLDIAITFTARGMSGCCGVCDLDAGTNFDGWRSVWIDRWGQCGISLAGGTDRGIQPLFPAQPRELSLACGQHHALILTERYLERGTFAPADFQPSAPDSIGDGLAALR